MDSWLIENVLWTDQLIAGFPTRKKEIKPAIDPSTSFSLLTKESIDDGRLERAIFLCGALSNSIVHRIHTAIKNEFFSANNLFEFSLFFIMMAENKNSF
jgi:hypothetical protein